MGGRGHDHLRPLSDCASSELRVVPVLCDRRTVQAGARRLLPPDHPLAMRAHDGLDAPEEVHVVLRRGGLRLVAADVEVRPGRQRSDLSDDVVDEPIGQLLTDAQRAEADLDTRVESGRDAVAAQLRVRRQRGVRVPGQVDLGHDGDVAGGRVRDELRVLALRVGASRAAPHLGAPPVPRQLRPGANREPPALIVREVQVQPVQLVESHQVDEPLDVGDPEEVPRDVEHRAAPDEARPVLDRPRPHPPRPRPNGRALDLRSQELSQASGRRERGRPGDTRSASRRRAAIRSR